MTAYELAQRAVAELGPNTTLNHGGKSQEYREHRQELVDCCGLEWARQLLREALEACAIKQKEPS